MITVIGLGFVGLSTIFKFSYFNNKKVYGYDINLDKINMLKKKKMYLSEKMFNNMLKETINKTFIPTNNLKEAINNSKYIIVCVGTDKNIDGSACLDNVINTINMIIDNINDDEKIIIIKSSIPPKTTNDILMPLLKGHTNLKICNNPEFLREGYCYEDIKEMDRIIIGRNDNSIDAKIKKLYSDDLDKLFFVSLNTGEFIKYLSNSMLASMISFSNEMAILADKIGDIDIGKSFKIIHKDKRWSNCDMKNYFYPGCGYGGYCLPKDTCALLDIGYKNNYEANILKEIINTNNNMINEITYKIEKNINKNSKIGILGLSFKPLSDDIRNTVAKPIIDKLIKDNYININAYDPVAIDNFKRNYKSLDINYYYNINDIINNSDILVIITGWDEFKNIKKLTNKTIIDCRYIL